MMVILRRFTTSSKFSTPSKVKATEVAYPMSSFGLDAVTSGANGAIQILMFTNKSLWLKSWKALENTTAKTSFSREVNR